MALVQTIKRIIFNESFVYITNYKTILVKVSIHQFALTLTLSNPCKSYIFIQSHGEHSECVHATMRGEGKRVLPWQRCTHALYEVVTSHSADRLAAGCLLSDSCYAITALGPKKEEDQNTHRRRAFTFHPLSVSDHLLCPACRSEAIDRAWNH